jgi:hypothetical protein
VEQQVREVRETGRLIGALVDSMGPADSLQIDQRVEAEQKGFTLGGSVFRFEGGNITVKQKVDVLSGTMIGLRIGRLDKAKLPESEGDAVSQLEELLRAR